MAAMYDGDNNRVFELDNTYKWEDCYGDEVLIPANQRTEDGNSPKEQLASLVKGGSNAKGYTLTEYINDINRENTEVLAEYGADEKVRQAYTYGESGIGERVSVDKSEESSYYLYDGRNSVTGILTENANLTNSYQYDPYGNLTSGTADGVNYYGYNGESTNVKTGLQYLRARYYNAENGTFTTEDSDLGTTENPLTRNRYDYATNNPLNYSDPTGHSLWSRIKSTAKKVAKKVVKSVVKAAKTAIKTVKNVVKTVKNAISHTSRSSRSSTISRSTRNVSTNSNAYKNNTFYTNASYNRTKMSKGVKLVGGHSKSKNKQYSSFYNFATIRSNEIRANINRIMCSTNKRINTLITGTKDNVNLTVTRGINISGTLGVWTYDFSIGLSFDAKGNVGIQHSFAGGVTASAAPSISAAGYTTVTNAPDIFELENEGSNVGGALAAPVMGVPVYASGDFVVTGDPNSSDKHYYGVTVAGGVGTPGGEVHAEISTTKTDASINVFDIIKKK